MPNVMLLRSICNEGCDASNKLESPLVARKRRSFRHVAVDGKFVRGWELRLFAIISAALLSAGNGWVLMSQDGTITFVAPVDIDAAWGKSRLTFKESREPKWDIYLDNDNNLRISELSQAVHHVVFTRAPNPVLSIQSAVHFGGNLGLEGELHLSSSSFVQSFARLKSKLLALEIVHVGASFVVRSFSRLTLILLALSKSRSEIPLLAVDFLCLAFLPLARSLVCLSFHTSFLDVLQTSSSVLARGITCLELASVSIDTLYGDIATFMRGVVRTGRGLSAMEVVHVGMVALLRGDVCLGTFPPVVSVSRLSSSMVMSDLLSSDFVVPPKVYSHSDLSSPSLGLSFFELFLSAANIVQLNFLLSVRRTPHSEMTTPASGISCSSILPLLLDYSHLGIPTPPRFPMCSGLCSAIVSLARLKVSVFISNFARVGVASALRGLGCSDVLSIVSAFAHFKAMVLLQFSPCVIALFVLLGMSRTKSLSSALDHVDLRALLSSRDAT